MIATLPEELRPWVQRLHVLRSTDTRAVLEGLIALRLVDDVTWDHVKTLASGLDEGSIGWAEVEEFRELAKRERRVAVKNMMEEMIRLRREKQNTRLPEPQSANEEEAD